MRLGLALAALGALLAGGAVRAADAGGFEEYELSGEAFERGLAAYRRGRLEEARQGFTEAIRRDGGFVEAMVNLARLYLERDEVEKATHWLDRAAAVRTNYPELYKVRALAALAEGRASDATVFLNKARRFAPEDVEVLVNLGAALLEVDGPGEAVAVLEQAVKLEPGCVPCVLNLAIGTDRQGDRHRAAYYYRRFLSRAPSRDRDREAVRTRLEELANRD